MPPRRREPAQRLRDPRVLDHLQSVPRLDVGDRAQSGTDVAAVLLELALELSLDVAPDPVP